MKYISNRIYKKECMSSSYPSNLISSDKTLPSTKVPSHHNNYKQKKTLLDSSPAHTHYPKLFTTPYSFHKIPLIPNLHPCFKIHHTIHAIRAREDLACLPACLPTYRQRSSPSARSYTTTNTNTNREPVNEIENLNPAHREHDRRAPFQETLTQAKISDSRSRHVLDRYRVLRTRRASTVQVRITMTVEVRASIGLDPRGGSKAIDGDFAMIGWDTEDDSTTTNEWLKRFVGLMRWEAGFVTLVRYRLLLIGFLAPLIEGVHGITKTC